MSGRAAIVGVGGLGSPAAAALVSSGVPLSLFDPDHVEISNLPRQPLYGIDDVGRTKVEAAAARLAAKTADAQIETECIALDARNAATHLAGHDVIVDATDGMDVKFLLNEAAVGLRIPLVHAGVLGLDGQLMTIVPGRSACLRCLFREMPDEDETPSCQQAGILGPVVGSVGLAAAREAEAILEGGPAPLENRLAILDGKALRWRSLTLKQYDACAICA